MRKQILGEAKVEAFLEDQIATISETKGYEVLSFEVMPDHVHLLFSAPPFDSSLRSQGVQRRHGVEAVQKVPGAQRRVLEGKTLVSKLLCGNCGACLI